MPRQTRPAAMRFSWTLAALAAPSAIGQSWELEQFVHGLSGRDMAATGIDDIWIAGVAKPGSSQTRLIHFDGDIWSFIDIPLDPQSKAIVHTWAVEMAPWGEPVIGGRIDNQPFAAIFRDGEIQDIQTFGGLSYTFSTVDFSIPNDECIWMSMSGNHRFARWDGVEWESFPLEDDHNLVFIEAVDAIGSDQAWAVGYERIFTDAPPGPVPAKPIVAVWSGKDWLRMVPPTHDAFQCMLFDIDVLSPNDIWAVGDCLYLNEGTRPAIFHWNGIAWTQHAIDGISLGQATSVAAIASDSVWIQGNRLNHFYYFDGTGWKIVNGSSALDPFVLMNKPNFMPSSYVLRQGQFSRIGPSELMALGFTSTGDLLPMLDGTFVERLVTHAPQSNSADVNGDGRIDSLDLQLVIQQFGLTVDD